LKKFPKYGWLPLLGFFAEQLPPPKPVTRTFVTPGSSRPHTRTSALPVLSQLPSTVRVLPGLIVWR